MTNLLSHKSRTGAACLISICFIAAGFFGTKLLPARAQSANEIRAKIEDRGANIDALNREIAEYQKELSRIGNEANTLENRIKEIDLSIKKLNTDIKLTEAKIRAAEAEIKRLSGRIGDTQDVIENGNEALKKSIKNLHEAGQSSLLEQMLSDTDLSAAWNRVEQTKQFQISVRENIDTLTIAKTNLETSRTTQEQARAKLLALKNELADQKKIVEGTKKEESALLAETKNRESSYQSLVAKNLALKQQFEAELRTYESQLKFILDPKTIPNRGSTVLSWPTDAVFITQLFGRTVDAVRLYASGSHSGVDFRASIGTPIKAAASGTVIGTGDTDLTCPRASFGKWILIEHTNGLSTAYGHLSLIKVTKGQKVAAGEVVAYSGNTGHTTGPHLHLTVYASAAVKVEERPSAACAGRNYIMPTAALNGYLDPMDYLPVPAASQIKR